MDLTYASDEEIDLYLSKKRPYKVKLVDNQNQKYYADGILCNNVYLAACSFAKKEFGQVRKHRDHSYIWSCKRWAYWYGTMFFLNEEDALLVKMNF